MYKIPSKVEGKQYELYKLEQVLKPIGYSIGGGWDYDKGYFDFKIADNDGYQFLRLPFTPVEGALDSDGTIVELGTPFLLTHVYQEDLDDLADTGNISASFDQFSEPKDKDAETPKKYVDFGKELVRELEQVILR
jgi:hypothetical protein